jgi:hypothetical protein
VREYRSIDETALVERAPHPNPLPVKNGEREREAGASLRFAFE